MICRYLAKAYGLAGNDDFTVVIHTLSIVILHFNQVAEIDSMCENVRDVKDAIRKEWNMQTGQLSEAWAKAQVIFCFDRGN